MTKSEKETIKKQKKEENESNNFLTKKKFTEMILESVKFLGKIKVLQLCNRWWKECYARHPFPVVLVYVRQATRNCSFNG